MGGNPKRLDYPRLFVIAVLLVICVGLEYYFHAVLGVEIVYTHLYYVPIVLAALWWGLKGAFPVSLILAFLHAGSHLPNVELSELSRSLTFILVGSTVGIFSDVRKRAEEELQRLKEFNEGIVQGVAEAILIEDASGIITFVNPALEALLGYTSDELVGRHWQTIVPQEEIGLVQARTSRRPEGITERYETRLLAKDGREIPVIVSARPLFQEGTFTGVLSAFTDITERKRAEEELRRSLEETARGQRLLLALSQAAQAVQRAPTPDELYRTIGDEISRLGYHAVILTLTDDGTHLAISHLTFKRDVVRAAEKLAGISVQEFRLPLVPDGPLQPILTEGKTTFAATGGLMAEALPAPMRPLASRLVALLGLQQSILAPLRVGGETFGLLTVNGAGLTEAEMSAVTAFANQVAIALENARLNEQTDEKLQDRVAELTALNAIAESLTRSLELDEMLKSIVTRVAQVMQTRICTIRLVEGNKLTIGAAVGYRDESSRQHTIEIDKRLAPIVRDQQPLAVKDLWRVKGIPRSRRERAKREGVHSFLGVPMISKGETIGVLSVYGENPHRFTEEEISLLLTIANQVAIAIENARLYERVKGHAEELERLVQERTRELQAIHAELLRSAKLAALGQLAAGVAHELNNPLGAISGYVEFLQEEVELGPRQMEYMERIEKRIQQSTKIVAELRSLGVPSEPAWEIVNVNDILEETLPLLERRLSLQQIEVQEDMTPDLPLMRADPDRLEQVFINLITNARQAMENGGTLRITARQSRSGEWVEIIFADTGEGIAKEHLDKIFDPFFSTRSPGKGMGLGLSLSDRHVRDHGGAIDVWSERGRGTVFRVALPPSGARRCWEILHCEEKERCKAVRENVDYRCWSVMEDVSRCERCKVYRRKALPPLDGTLLPQ